MEIMRQHRLVDSASEVPRIMNFLAQGILKLNGQQTEGIFRVPGDADQVTGLHVRIEKKQYDMSGIHDASVPASLLNHGSVTWPIPSSHRNCTITAFKTPSRPSVHWA